MTDRENLLDLVPAEAEERLRAFMGERGEPGYRAAQVGRRLWMNRVDDGAAGGSARGAR